MGLVLFRVLHTTGHTLEGSALNLPRIDMRFFASCRARRVKLKKVQLGPRGVTTNSGLGFFRHKIGQNWQNTDFEIELHRNGASWRDTTGDQKDGPITVLCTCEDRIRLSQSVYFTEIVFQIGGHPESGILDQSTRHCIESIKHVEHLLTPLDCAGWSE